MQAFRWHGMLSSFVYGNLYFLTALDAILNLGEKVRLSVCDDSQSMFLYKQRIKGPI